VTQRNDKSKAITNLLSTATTMLKNGATPDVVDFAQATLNEITSIVLPAITNASATDQQLVTTTFVMFESALQELEDGNNLVRAAHDEERRLSAAHKACRAIEEVKCEEKRECDYDLYEVWRNFVEQESIMRQLSTQVSEHFCVEDANGTMWIFRDHAVTLFPPFIEQKPIVERWEHDYDIKVPVCETKYTILDEKTAECDALQTQLELAACAHHAQVQHVRELFAAAWYYATITYQRVVDEVHCLEVDRWKEWRTLATVQCLLDETTARNGRPCEETTDEATTVLARCEEIQSTENVDHLRIIYHVIPEFPPFCLTPPWEVIPEIHPFPGRCVPVPPQVPCSAGYIAQEYAELWTPPQPEFHSENSHCNQRPECSLCPTEPEIPICGVLFYQSHDWFVYPEAEHECHPTTRQYLDNGGHPIVWEDVRTIHVD